jgi:protein O-mannosyl-transferase
MSKKKKRLEEASGPADGSVNTSPAANGAVWAWRAAIALTVVILFWRATAFVFLVPGEGTRLLPNAKIAGPVQDWMAAFGSAWEWQPLAWWSHMVDFVLFGAKSEPQRSLSLLLHILNSLLVFGILRRLTGVVTNSGIAALLFALHPLRIEPVIWLIERRTLLATLFTLLAIRCYTHYRDDRRTLWRGLVFVCGVLAALSHPAGAVLPLLLLLIDVWPLDRTEPLGERLAEKLELGAVSLFTIAMSVRGTANAEAAWSNGVFDVGTRLWHSACGVGVALLRSVLPFPLDQYPSLEPPVWAIGLVAVAIAAAWLGPKPLRVGVIWFFVAMVPTLGLVHPEVSPWRDSGTYLAHVGLLAGVVWYLAALDRDKLVAVAGCLGLLWFGLGWLRVSEWSLGETLLRTSVERGGHPLAHYQLGQLLLETGRLGEGEKQLQAVIAARPRQVEARLLLAAALAQTKRNGAAVAQLEEVIRTAPERPDGYFALGLMRTQAGQAGEGARYFADAMKRGLATEQEAQAENAIGVYHLNEKRYEEAAQHLERSWKLAPTYASAHANFGRALLAQGQTRRAYAYLERARLYTKEAKEVVDVWTMVFNRLAEEEKKKAEQGAAAAREQKKK